MGCLISLGITQVDLQRIRKGGVFDDSYSIFFFLFFN